MVALPHKILKYSKSISYIFWLGLFCYFLLIKWYAGPLLAFHVHYPLYWVNQLFRSFFNQIPITLGEWMYVVMVVIFVIKLVQIIIDMIRNGWLWNKRVASLKRFLGFVFKGWLIFELIWGVGYYVPAPPEKMSFQNVPSYSIETLDSLSQRLIVNLNALREKISDEQIDQLDFEQAKSISIEAYQQIHSFAYPNLKKATLPVLGDYIGYTAFYQPFTTEAIVRADVPNLELPFTMIHELAHQNGFASEQVANFMAFMIAKNAIQPIIQYSLYLQLFTYTQQAILSECLQDNNVEAFSKLVLQYKKLLSLKVINDRKNIKAFWRKHSGLQIEASEIAFDQFLKWHQQKAGIHSYNEVLLWIIGYENKYGKQF
jgi:hypothetical protein